jgi:Protein of unknown function (DUF3110)
MRVYVLLFNAGTDNEGIHTLKLGDRNTILMFEAEDDALRYSLMLEAQDFPLATIERMDSEEIEEFCQEADYDCKFISEESLEVPPEASVEDFEWQAEGDRTPASAPETSEKPEFSEAELDQFRRRLEGLL